MWVTYWLFYTLEILKVFYLYFTTCTYLVNNSLYAELNANIMPIYDVAIKIPITKSST
jgi:hypothetical protein